MREATVHWLPNGSITVAIRSPVNSVAWFLERTCTTIYGAMVNKINIGHVDIECASSWLISFERPHHRNN